MRGRKWSELTEAEKEEWARVAIFLATTPTSVDLTRPVHHVLRIVPPYDVVDGAGRMSIAGVCLECSCGYQSTSYADAARHQREALRGEQRLALMLGE